MAASVASTMPSTAPRQPAWAAPMTRASGSWKRTGAQSAVRTLMATAGSAVTAASARGRSAPAFRAGGDHLGAVHLVEREEPRRGDAEGLGHAGAVERHRLALVGGAGAAVEPGVDAGGGAAAAGEEAVPRARQQVGGQDFEGHQANPGGGGAPSGRSARTWKREPISSGWVKRRCAAAIASCVSAGRPRASARARAVMPRRSRKSALAARFRRRGPGGRPRRGRGSGRGR